MRAGTGRNFCGATCARRTRLRAPAGGVHRRDHGQVQPLLPDVPAGDAQAAQSGHVGRASSTRLVRESGAHRRAHDADRAGRAVHGSARSSTASSSARSIPSRRCSRPTAPSWTRKIAARLLDTPLEQITLSFDGSTKESFEFYRKGAKFEKVRDNFVRFARMKKERGSKLQVVVQMVRMERNAGEVDDFIRFWRPCPAWTRCASRKTRPT